MIISFSLENWMSFSEPVSFSMVASRERQHGDRVSKVAKYSTRILPIAAIYGGNASGKTNFFQALSFIRKLVVRGTRPDSLIPVEPYRLNKKSLKAPSRFKLELLIEDSIYEFSFAVTRKAVTEERLVQITGTKEKTLYNRQGDALNFDNSLNKDKRLHFAFAGTRNNQLFLTNSVSQKVDIFKPVYDWFRDALVLIAPDSRFETFELFLDDDQPMYEIMKDMLSQLDTGISHLGLEEVPFNSVPFPEEIKDKLEEEVPEDKDMKIRVHSPTTYECFVITRRDGELVAKKLVAFHPRSDGTEAKFDLHQESDGSQRVIDLLPAFLELSTTGSKRVFVIDEVDRSLHSLLLRQLLETYLESCSTQSRAQLLITTHDVFLMDQNLFRRDEIWVSERNAEGISDLFSLSEYRDIRYDKNIRNSYLHGRLGGIPRIGVGNTLVNEGKGI